MVDLTDNLMPKDSPIDVNNPQTTGFSFDAENEAGVISSAKMRNASIVHAKIGTAAIGTANIGTLTFNEIEGGTARLGGTANGDGVLQVMNALGGTIVTVNNNGISVSNGSITIQNSSGSSVLDYLGVSSQNNFNGVSLFGNPLQTTSSTSFVNITGGTITPLVLTRESRVLLFFWFYGYNDAILPDRRSIEARIYDQTSGSVYINNYCAGIPITTVDFDTFTGAYYVMAQSVYRQGIGNLSAGTYNWNLQYKAVGGGNAFCANFEMGYMVLGK